MMRLSIRHNNNQLVEFDQFAINGSQAASGYAFTFVFRGSRFSSKLSLTIFDLKLDLSLAEPVSPLLASLSASDSVRQCNEYTSNNEQIHFKAILTRRQVCALEEYRKEGDLKLGVGLRSLIVSPDGLCSDFDISEITVPRDQWLNALKASGFRETLLFEVPLPAISEDLIFTLNKAREFLEIGHYKEAVIQCRHLIEEIETLRNDKSEAAAANDKAHGKERRNMSSIERMLSLREQLKNICQLGAHGREGFTRSQAKAVLGMTMALLGDPSVGLAKVLHED